MKIAKERKLNYNTKKSYFYNKYLRKKLLAEIFGEKIFKIIKKIVLHET